MGSQTPAQGPPSFSPHTSSSAAPPTGSVHKSQTVSVHTPAPRERGLIHTNRLAQHRPFLSSGAFWPRDNSCPLLPVHSQWPRVVPHVTFLYHPQDPHLYSLIGMMCHIVGGHAQLAQTTDPTIFNPLHYHL